MTKREKVISVIAVACSLLLAAACAFSITLFGDDYGYVRYTDGGVAAFLSRMAAHFSEVNGRTLVHALDVFLLQAGGILGKIAVFLLIPLFWLGAARVALPDGGKKKLPAAVAALSVLFWLVGLPALRESVFWITGAVNYLLPATLLVWQADAARCCRTAGKGYVRFAVLSVLTAASTEIAAAVSLLITLGFLIESATTKRSTAPLVAPLVLSLAAAATVFFAPGNALRASFYPAFYGQPFFSRIAGHFAEFASVCLSDTGILPALVLLAAAVFARCARKKQYGLAAAAAVPAALSVLADVFGLLSGESAVLGALPVVVTGTVLVVIFLTDAKRSAVPLALTLAAAGIQLAMLASPVFGPRTTFLSSVLFLIAAVRTVLEDGVSLPLAIAAAAAVPVFLPVRLIISVPAAAAAALLALAVHFITRRKTANVLALCLAAVILGGGAAVARGYVRNGIVYRGNDRRIDACLEGEADGIDLILPPAPACRYTYICDGSAWHNEQFRLWRGIPAETVIRWSEGGGTND